MVSAPDIQFPDPVDPTNLAREQGTQNLQAAIATALLNQQNQVGPFGTVSFTQNQPTGGGGLQPQIFGTPQRIGVPQIPPNLGGGPLGGPGQAFFGGQMGPFGDVGAEGAGPLGGFTGGAGLGVPTGGGFGGQFGGGGGGFNIGGINIPQFTRTTTLTPAAQAQLEASQGLGRDVTQLAGQNVEAVRRAQQGGLGFEGLPLSVSGINAAPISGFQAPGGAIQSTLRQFDPQAGIQTQGLFGLGGDFADEARSLEQATFQRGRSLLEPGFSQQQEQAEIRLAERGLPLSSQAAQGILGGLQTARGRTLNELALSSVAAGRQEQERLSQQRARLRGQQFGERTTQFGAVGQAAGQRFGQGLATGQFGQQAQAQQFQQAALGNQLGLGAQAQSFQQAQVNAAIQNAARASGFQERAFLRNVPINDIAALLGTAPGVQLPQFQPTPNVGVAAPDLIGATLGAGQIGTQRGQIQAGANNALLGGLFGLAGDIGGAALFASDIRVKDNIKRIGLVNGIPLYKFRYKGENEETLGVMAQEVEQWMPDAVFEIDGIKHVDYSMILEVQGHG